MVGDMKRRADSMRRRIPTIRQKHARSLNPTGQFRSRLRNHRQQSLFFFIYRDADDPPGTAILLLSIKQRPSQAD